MSEMSISELSALTGFTRETVGKRLADIPHTAAGNAKRYDPRQALPALYEVACNSGQIDLMRERAMLARSQRQKIDLEIGVMQRELLPASLVASVWGGMTTAARQRLLAIPYRMATAALAADGFAAIETAANELIREALNELHQYNPADYRPADAGANRTDTRMDVPTAAYVDGQPVGGSASPPKQRGKRGAGPVANR